MKLSPVLHTGSLFACAVLLGLSYERASSRPAQLASGPRSQDIVNLDGQVRPDRSKSHVIFEVPSDQALVVTDVSILSSPVIQRFGPHLVERLGARDTVKRSRVHRYYRNDLQEEGWTPLVYRSSTGLVFAPDSKVVLLFPTNGGTWHYNVTGYLTKL